MTDRTPSSSGDDPEENADYAPLVAADLSADQRDEIVSAYLDGEATEAEIILVQSTPDLLERVEVFRSLSDPIASIVTVDADVREAQIAAALLAARPPEISIVPDASSEFVSDQAPPLDQFDPELSPVVELTSRRRVPPRWLAAAACFVALAIAVPFALSAGDSDSDSATEAGDDTISSGFAADQKAPETSSAPSATEAQDGSDAEATAMAAVATTEAMDEAVVGDTDSTATDGAALDESADDGTDDSGPAAELTPGRSNFIDITDLEPGFFTSEQFADAVESRRLSTIDQELAFDGTATATREALVELCPELDIPINADVIESIVVLQQQVFAVIDESSTTVYLSDCSIGAQVP